MKVRIYVGPILWCEIDDDFDTAVKVAKGLSRKGMAVSMEVTDKTGAVVWIAEDLSQHAERYVWPIHERKKRIGATGRPKLSGTVITPRLRLSDSQLAAIKHLGNGDTTAGIITAIDAAVHG